MLRDQFHVATSFLPTVGFPRHQNFRSRPPSLQPMSRPQVAPQSFQLCRNLKISGCNTLKTNPGRDLKSMSRPQTVHPRSQRGFSCHDQGLLTRNLSQVTTPKRMSRHQLLQSRSRCQTMSRPHPVWPRSRARCPGRGCALLLSWALLRRSRPCLAHLVSSCHDLKTRS